MSLSFAIVICIHKTMSFWAVDVDGDLFSFVGFAFVCIILQSCCVVIWFIRQIVQILFSAPSRLCHRQWNSVQREWCVYFSKMMCRPFACERHKTWASATHTHTHEIMSGSIRGVLSMHFSSNSNIHVERQRQQHKQQQRGKKNPTQNHSAFASVLSYKKLLAFSGMCN